MINRGNLGRHMLENSQKNRHMLLSMAADFLGEKLEGQVNVGGNFLGDFFSVFVWELFPVFGGLMVLIGICSVLQLSSLICMVLLMLLLLLLWLDGWMEGWMDGWLVGWLVG